jgi:hypothetical protein
LSTATDAKKNASRLASLLAVAIMLLAVTVGPVAGSGKIDSQGVVNGAPGGIAGLIKDNVTGTPVGGVSVTFKENTNGVKGTVVSTILGGYGNTSAIGDGTYSVIFKHKDYEPFTVPGIVVTTGKTYYLNVSLNPIPSTVHGIVKDAISGMWVDGASVTLVDGFMNPMMTTGPDGAYSLQTISRSVKVTVSATGYIAYDSGIMPILINSTNDIATISLNRTTVHLDGEIHGSGGIADATVYLVGYKTFDTKTNETGYYAFDVEWGDYMLAVTKDGYFITSQQVSLQPGQPASRDMSLSRTPEQNAEVFGYVKDKVTNLPIAGVAVCMVDHELDEQLCMMTGADGYFHFSIYPGYFEAQFSLANYKGYKTYVSVTKGDSKNMGDILLQVLPPMDKQVSGLVKSGVTPIAGASVSIYDGDILAASGNTDITGNYAIFTYAGTFTIKATAGGYFDTAQTGVVVSANKVVNFDMIAVPAMKDMVYGYIKDQAHKPIKGASVMLVDTAIGHSWYSVQATTTDGGYYTFNIYDGSFLFIVDATGFNAELKKVTISANVQQDMSLNDSGQEALTMSVVFKDWTNLSLGMETHMVNDVKLLRHDIDSTYGNGDGMVSAAEADAWLNVELAKGPVAKDTEGMLTVDGTAYGIVDGSFMVKATGAEGDVMSPDEIVLMKGANFTAMVPIVAQKNHTVRYTAAFDTKFIDNSTELTVPAGWEARHIDAEYVTVSGTFTVGMDPPMAKTGLDSETVLINVTGNSVPNADAGKNRTIKVNNNETFDASASSDDFGISNYTWNFGDGKTGYGVSVVHKFSLTSPADMHNYTVTLTVKDTAGLTNLTKIWVLVDGAPPVALFTAVAPNKNVTGAGLPLAQEDKEKIDFNASGSTDNVGIANYTWKFSDGKFGYGKALNHTWIQPGEYNVTLNITDSAGWWANMTIKVTIRDITVPRARVTYNGDSLIYIEDKKLLVLNGSLSTDNVKVVKYTWNFGDKSATKEGMEVNYTYTTAGKFNVTLNVSDAAGNTNVSTPILIELKSKPKIPDLSITSIKVENAASFKIAGNDIHDGDRVKITIVVKNSGNGAIDSSSDNKDYSVQFTYGSHKITTKYKLTIAANNATSTVFVYWPKAVQGKFKICAEADPENRIGEKDDGNNRKCSGDVNITYSWVIIGGISGGIIAVVALVAVAYRLQTKRAEERKEKLRQRKKIR